jgi:hypothetical protein
MIGGTPAFHFRHFQGVPVGGHQSLPSLTRFDLTTLTFHHSTFGVPRYRLSHANDYDRMQPYDKEFDGDDPNIHGLILTPHTFECGRQFASVSDGSIFYMDDR